MKFILLVGAGSFIGGSARFLLSEWIQTKTLSSFPYATLTVNLIGCFAIGLVFGFIEKTQPPLDWRLFVTTGILGGFTTFSALSVETFSMIRTGNISNAVIYILLSTIMGILFTAIGFLIVKAI
ncbi:MAG TPA: fluoride efflux transporter CrcB [Saprospiraceae bacterium]|nr:fluoride efflux transporter CrcB [Saprospiraceae bacterium]